MQLLFPKFFTSRRRATCIAFTIAFGAALSVSAQTSTGELDGIVRDKSGAVVPNAEVVITNTDEHQVVRTVKTDGQGQFTAPLLNIGTYSVEVSAKGFEKTSVTNLSVHVGVPTNVPVNMTNGGTTETVNVDAIQNNIQLDSAAAGTLIDSVQTTQLPLSNRNYLQLMSIQPGISGPIPGENPRGNIKSTGAVNVQTYSVNGNATSTNGYYLDGADTLKRAGQQPVTFPSVDFIAEINLIRGSYGADIGGPGAASVNVQTKSGSTAFHGGAFEFYRDDIFNANTPLFKQAGTARAETRWNNWGYYLSGPIWIPGKTSRANAKTFFFFGQERLRSLDGNPISISNIPTAAQRLGQFTTPVCPKLGGCGAAGVTQITPIDPVAQAYLKDIYQFVPVPNNPFDPQGYIGVGIGTNNETQTFIRIDRQFSSKLSAFFRYLDDPFRVNSPFGFQVVSQVPNVARASITNGSTTWMGHATYVLNNHTVFEGAYTQRANWVTSADTGTIATANAPDVAAAITLPYVNTLDHVPSLVVGGSNLKGSGFYNERSPERQIYVNNTNTWGRHTIEAGVNFELQTSYSNNAGANSGSFTAGATAVPTGSGTTAFAQAFANFLAGHPTNFTQAAVDSASALESNIYEGFIQDNVRLSSRLTVLAGVRYTFFQPYSNAVYQNQPFHPTQNFYGPAYSPVQAPALTAAGNFPTGFNVNGYTNGIIVGGVNSPFGNSGGDAHPLGFAPRVGFTYDVFGDGRTALRGGFGVYYDQVIGNTAKFATNQDPPNVATLTVTNPSSFANPAGTSVPSPQGLQAYDATRALPYTMQYSLDLQQQITPLISLDIGYYGNEGRHQTANIDLNQPAPNAFRTLPGAPTTNITAGANTTLLNLVRPYQGWSFITDVAGIFNLNYNSMQNSLRVQTRRGVRFVVNYTWSRALTNARTPQCNCNLRAEYGPTDINRNDIFSAAFTYPLPFLAQNHHWYGYALGGWQTSGIISYASGQYLTASDGAVDPAGLGLLVGPATGRPNQISDPNNGAQHAKYLSQGKWFNTAAFARATFGTIGNAPAADIRGPGYEVWNLSLYKNFTLHANYKLQLRWETFNTFNHANPNAVATGLDGTNYGQVTGYGDPRRMQIAAKITF